MKRDTIRSREANGRYDHDNMALLCECGHTLGHHTAAQPRECIAGDFGHGSCDCVAFRKARKQP